jgi:hypothetical protein
VRRIFALYLELGCVRRVKEEADRLGLRMKRSMTANGTELGGKPTSEFVTDSLLEGSGFEPSVPPPEIVVDPSGSRRDHRAK